MHSIRHCEGVSISVCVIRVRAKRKQCFNGVHCFRVLPRSPDSKVEQRRAVSSGCLQIGGALCGSTDGLRIVSDDTLCHSEQRWLITEVPSSRVQLCLYLAPMLLAFFHVQVKSNE